MSDDLLQKAIQLAKSQNREAAIPLLVHILKAEPDNVEAWSSLLELLGDDQRRAVLSALVQKNLGGPAAREVLDVISAEDLKPYLADVSGEMEEEPEEPGEVEVNPSPFTTEDWQPESQTAYEQADVGEPDDQAGQFQNPAQAGDLWNTGENMVAPEAEPDSGDQLPVGDAAQDAVDQTENIPVSLTSDETEPSGAPGAAGAEEDHPADLPPVEQPYADRDPLAELRALSESNPSDTGGSAWQPEWQPGADAPQPELEEAASSRIDASETDPGPVFSTPITRRSRRRNQANCLALILAALLVVIVAGLAVIILFRLGYINLDFIPGFSTASPATVSQPLPSPTLEPSFEPSLFPSLAPTATELATLTPVPSPTPAPTDTPLPSLTPTASVGQIIQSAVDGASLVYIPAGSFLMGWNFGDPGETTVHRVNLDAYWIDLTEVTNKTYAACVAAGVCSPPAETKSYKRPDYFNSADFADFPVVYVNWQQAYDYCAWAGRRLPSEAQWEFAARGEDNRLFPWGKDAPNRDLANFGFNNLDTTRVGSYPAGASPFGVLDMAGNVSEWVNDWYLENYYTTSPVDNPPGPQQGVVRAFRGGSFANQADKIRSTRRVYDEPVYVSSSLGFRCAQDAP